MSDRVITPEEIEAAQATLDARRERIGHDQARLNEAITESAHEALAGPYEAARAENTRIKAERDEYRYQRDLHKAAADKEDQFAVLRTALTAYKYENARLRAENARLRVVAAAADKAEREVEQLKAAARAYLDCATYPDWSAGDCRYCLAFSDHTDECPYAKAEKALLAVLEK